MTKRPIKMCLTSLKNVKPKPTRICLMSEPWSALCRDFILNRLNGKCCRLDLWYIPAHPDRGADLTCDAALFWPLGADLGPSELVQDLSNYPWQFRICQTIHDSSGFVKLSMTVQDLSNCPWQFVQDLSDCPWQLAQDLSNCPWQFRTCQTVHDS